MLHGEPISSCVHESPPKVRPRVTVRLSASLCFLSFSGACMYLGCYSCWCGIRVEYINRTAIRSTQTLFCQPCGVHRAVVNPSTRDLCDLVDLGSLAVEGLRAQNAAVIESQSNLRCECHLLIPSNNHNITPLPNGCQEQNITCLNYPHLTHWCNLFSSYGDGTTKRVST